MSISVPAAYQGYVTRAASATGLPASVVAAQIQDESGWNPNAVSPAGAEGIAQFEPATFAQYGSGSPFNVSDAFNAYDNYMGALLKQYNGNVAAALSAYNSGSPTASIGSYANPILQEAGQGISLSTGTSPSNGANPGSVTTTGFNVTDPSSWLPSLLSPITGSLEQGINDILERGALIVFGAALVIIGVLKFTSAKNSKVITQAQDQSKSEVKKKFAEGAEDG